MPNPMLGDGSPPRPEGPARHAARPDDDTPGLARGATSGVRRHREMRLREVPAPRAAAPEPAHDGPRPRGEIAVDLPAWDLLPPVEFVRRHRDGS